jgi:hypothetical protein
MTRWNLMLTVLVVVMLVGLAVALAGCGSDSATGDPDVVGMFQAYPEALNPGGGNLDIILLPQSAKPVVVSDDNLVLSNCWLYLDEGGNAEFTAWLGETTVSYVDGAKLDFQGEWEQDGSLVNVDMDGYYPMGQDPPDMTATIDLTFAGDDAAGGTLSVTIFDEEYDGTIAVVRSEDL